MLISKIVTRTGTLLTTTLTATLLSQVPAAASNQSELAFKAMTYNVMMNQVKYQTGYPTKEHKANTWLNTPNNLQWGNRRQYIINTIKTRNIDLVGIQEGVRRAEPNDIATPGKDIVNGLKPYNYASSSDGITGAGTAILWRKQTFTRVDSGNSKFTCGNTGGYSSNPEWNWALLSRNKPGASATGAGAKASGHRILVINMHGIAEGCKYTTAQKREINVKNSQRIYEVRRFAEKWRRQGARVILMGDLNPRTEEKSSPVVAAMSSFLPNANSAEAERIPALKSSFPAPVSNGLAKVPASWNTTLSRKCISCGTPRGNHYNLKFIYGANGADRANPMDYIFHSGQLVVEKNSAGDPMRQVVNNKVSSGLGKWGYPSDHLPYQVRLGFKTS